MVNMGTIKDIIQEVYITREVYIIKVITKARGPEEVTPMWAWDQNPDIMWENG